MKQWKIGKILELKLPYFEEKNLNKTRFSFLWFQNFLCYFESNCPTVHSNLRKIGKDGFDRFYMN